mmetsp:Transcript_88555/g.177047  ORF Transcript_88555/g.177047 Transcript_88555/m.177047 type:complete len:81 (-) Transcript_88555:597-839(-)
MPFELFPSQVAAEIWSAADVKELSLALCASFVLEFELSPYCNPISFDSDKAEFVSGIADRDDDAAQPSMTFDGTSIILHF